jgi:hypothetical protein
MKKLLGILLLVLFAFSIYFTISNDVTTNSNNSPGYASIIPIPPPDPPARRGA